MPELNVVTVDPDGLEVEVAIGGTPTAYTTSAGTATHSLPVTISTPTEFWLAENVDYTFVVSKNDTELYRETVGVSYREDQRKTVRLAGNLTLGDIAASGDASSGASAPTDRVYLYTDATSTLANGNEDTVTLDAFDDPPGLVGTITHDGIGAVIGTAGVYSLLAEVDFPDATDATMRHIRFLIGGSSEPSEVPAVRVAAIDGSDTRLVLSVPDVPLDLGATVRVAAQQGSGASMDLDYAFLYVKRTG